MNIKDLGNVCKIMSINGKIGEKDRKYKLMIKSGMYWGCRQCTCEHILLTDWNMKIICGVKFSGEAH